MKRHLKFKTLLLITSFLACQLPAYAFNSPSYLSWDGFALVEDVDNFKANLKRGNVVDLVAQIIAKVDTKKANLWSNGEFDVGLLGVYVTNNQYLFSGLLQTPSNYYSPNSEIRFSNLSYKHTWNNKTTFVAGIMDYADYFDVVDSPTSLVNLAFGTVETLEIDALGSTYPYPGFGAILQVPTKYINFLAGIFQGDPKHQYSLFHEGYMLLGEVSGDINIEPRSNVTYTFKLGGWHYQQSNPNVGYTNNGIYLLGERQWKNGDCEPRSIFVQSSAAPTENNIGQYSLSIGFNMNALFPQRVNDILSIGYTQLWVHHNSPEVVWELGYTIMFNKHICLVPDLQFGFHPSGIYPLEAFVGLLRLKYSLSDLY